MKRSGVEAPDKSYKLLEVARMTFPLVTSYKMLNKLSAEDIERFWKKVSKGHGCWLWTGAPNSEGYGFFWAGGRSGTNYLTHRISYELAKGPIPDGNVHLDHLCRVRICCNPEHLEVVTPRENCIRGIAPSARNAIAIACYNGHPFDSINTRILKSGSRECKTCRRAHTVRMNMKKNHPERFAQLDTIIPDLMGWLNI